MRSHFYACSAIEFVKTMAAPLAGAALLAGGLQCAFWLGMLPRVKPLDNPDETLVAVKLQLSQSRHPAQVILLGDSSCATGIDAVKLRAVLPGRPGVLNLGLYIGFGLDIYGELLADYAKYNPDQVRLVVLLVTPRFLLDQSVAPTAYDFWRRAHLREENAPAWEGKGLSRLLGLGLLKDRLLRVVLHAPIPRGRFYGFSADLADYLSRHEGSMIEPGLFHPPLHPNLSRYYLAPSLEQASRDFRRQLPRGVKLAIGITPVPESLCSREYLTNRDELLLAWNRWLGAEYVLTNAPAKLPDTFFASADHPNPAGQERITRQLGVLLSRAWSSLEP